MYKRQLNFSATYVKQRNTHAPHLGAWHEIMSACKIDKILASNIVTYNKLKLRRHVSKECVVIFTFTYFFYKKKKKPTTPQGVQAGILGVQKGP